MGTTRLTERQAAEVASRIGPMSEYLAKLLARMRPCDWTPDDVLYQGVQRADEAMRGIAEVLRPPPGVAMLTFNRARRDKRLRERDKP